MALTTKQRRFVDEYLIDLNATQAAIRAGYSTKRADAIGYENLRKPDIAEAIASAMKAREQRIEVDADYVFKRLVEIDQMDVLDILTDSMSFKPVSDWPKVWRQYLSGFDLAEMFEGTGGEREMVGILKKIKWPDKIKNLELLGRRVKIHPDRVFVLGDWSGDAIGWLEPAYNAFVSLEKVEGGSGESFLKNAARQLNINFDKEIDFTNLASMYGVSVSELQDKFNEAALELNRGNDVVMPTQGDNVTPLVTAVPDPRPTYDINLQTVSAALDTPSRILVGNQQGERASTEDQRYFNASRQADRLNRSFEIEDFTDQLIRVGVLDAIGEKTVMWDDLNEQTAIEKLDSAKTMSEINSTAIATGEAVFDSDEIRTAAGYDPNGGEPLGEGIEDEYEDGNEAAATDPTK